MTALRADAGMPPARLKRRKYMSTALLLVDELGRASAGPRFKVQRPSRSFRRSFAGCAVQSSGTAPRLQLFLLGSV